MMLLEQPQSSNHLLEGNCEQQLPEKTASCQLQHYCQLTVGQQVCFKLLTDCGQLVDPLCTNCQPTVDRLLAACQLKVESTVVSLQPVICH